MQAIKIFGGFLLLGASVFTQTSCTNKEANAVEASREKKLVEVMLDRPQAELDEIYDNLRESPLTKSVQMQRAIDSVVFRRIYESSQLMKDSTFVNAYNTMMAKTSVPTKESYAGYIIDSKELDKNYRRMVTVREMSRLRNNPMMTKRETAETNKQFIIDSVANNRLLKESSRNREVIQRVNAVCKKIKP